MEIMIAVAFCLSVALVISGVVVGFWLMVSIAWSGIKKIRSL
jgi:hypothetical protein